MFKYLIFLALFIYSSYNWSQNTRRDLLIEAIAREFPVIFSQELLAEDSIILHSKFADAELFLKNKMKDFVLVDSSDYYQRKMKELMYLMNSNNGDFSKETKTKIDQTYLLLSVSKVRNSDALFILLIGNFLNKETNFNNYSELESALFYKSWLYGILDNQFKSETNSFLYHNALLYYNKIAQNIGLQFINIEKEEALLSKLNIWTKLATECGCLEYDYNELIVKIYRKRIAEANEALIVNYSNNLFDFIERKYLDALTVAPEDNELKYSFGVFYYNTAAELSSKSTEGLSAEDMKIREDKIKQLRKKAIPLMSTK